MRVWAVHVIPSLFPYMIMCRLLADEMKKKNISAYLSVPILGFLGGSPSGASVLAGYGGHIHQRKLHALCALTGTISPMFFLSTVSGWLNDPRLGKLLLLSNAFAAFISSLVVYALSRRYSEKHSVVFKQNTTASENPLLQTITAILTVGGNIVLFSVIAGYLSVINWIPRHIYALLHALLEAAGGVYALTQTPMNAQMRAVIISAATGFGGCSILFQNLSFLSSCGIKLRHLVIYGTIRAAISCAAMALLLSIL